MLLFLSFQKLGFASCKRNSGATEGINVLLEKKNLDGNWAYGFSCIEYTEFDKFGITAGPLSPGGYFSLPCTLDDYDIHSHMIVFHIMMFFLVLHTLTGMFLSMKKIYNDF